MKFFKKKKIIYFYLFLIISASVYLVPERSPYFNSDKSIVYENSQLKVEQTGEVSNLSVSFLNVDKIFAHEDHFLFYDDKKSNLFTSVGHLDKIHPSIFGKIKNFVARQRATRLIRENFPLRNVVVLQSGTILVFYDYIYRSEDGGKTFEPVFDFSKEEINGPFRQGIAIDGEGNIFFGEYQSEKRPHEISIIRGFDDGKHWEKFYTFPSGNIFHIHSIKYDRFRNLLWVCTGDRDGESNLMLLDRASKKVIPVGGGDQGWRIVSLMVTKDYLVWCSDNDQTGSFVYRFNPATKVRQKLFPIGKSSYYSTVLKDGTLVFSTAFEYRAPFVKKANPDSTADLWVSKDSLQWFKVASFPEADGIRVKGAERPQLIIPNSLNSDDDYLYFSPFMTKIHNNSLLAYKITWK